METKRPHPVPPRSPVTAPTQFRVSPTHGGRQGGGEDTSEMEVARGDGNYVTSLGEGRQGDTDAKVGVGFEGGHQRHCRQLELFETPTHAGRVLGMTGLDEVAHGLGTGGRVGGEVQQKR